MKTLTEIPGSQLKEVYALRAELIQLKHEGKLPVAPPKEPAPSSDPSNLDPPVSAEAAPPVEITPVPEPPVSVEPAPSEPVTPSVTPYDETRIKSPDERYAEFMKKKSAEEEKRRQEWTDLVAAIKEPFAARLKEKFQWSDDRINFALQALEVIDRERLNTLRRVIVWKMDKPEELLPRGGRRVDEHVFVAEYLDRPKPPEQKGRPDRGGKRRGKGDKRGGRPGMRADRSGPPKPGDARGPRPPGRGQPSRGSRGPKATSSPRPPIPKP